MKPSIDRRAFLKQTAVVGTGLVTIGNAAKLRAGGGANNKIVVAVMERTNIGPANTGRVGNRRSD